MNIFNRITLIFTLCSTMAYSMQRVPSSLIEAMKTGVDRYTIEKMVARNAKKYVHEVNEKNQTALMLAILHKHHAIIAPLIDAMSYKQLQRQDKRGSSALSYAINLENIHAYKLLERKLQICISIPDDWFAQ